MAFINTAAGNEAVLELYDWDTANSAIVETDPLTVPLMTDVTINNSTGTFRFKTLDSTSESVVTTPATNQVSVNVIIDDLAFFGNAAATSTVRTDGISKTSVDKTQVGFRVYFDGTDSGSKYYEGSAFIGGIAATVNPDSPLWTTPVTLEVNGDFTVATVS